MRFEVSRIYPSNRIQPISRIPTIPLCLNKKRGSGPSEFFFPGNHFSEHDPHTDTREHTTRNKRDRPNTSGFSQDSSPRAGGPLRGRQGLEITLSRWAQSGRMIDLQYDRGREEEGGRRTCGARASVQKPVNRIRACTGGVHWSRASPGGSGWRPPCTSGH